MTGTTDSTDFNGAIFWGQCTTSGDTIEYTYLVDDISKLKTELVKTEKELEQVLAKNRALERRLARQGELIVALRKSRYGFDKDAIEL